MWNYEKRLQYPVKITQTNPKIAQVIITQFGGPCCSNLSYFFVYIYIILTYLIRFYTVLMISATGLFHLCRRLLLRLYRHIPILNSLCQAETHGI